MHGVRKQKICTHNPIEGLGKLHHRKQDEIYRRVSDLAGVGVKKP